jgi:hypothetical protein
VTETANIATDQNRSSRFGVARDAQPHTCAKASRSCRSQPRCVFLATVRQVAQMSD